MKIRFKEARKTVKFGTVDAGQVKDLPKAEAEAFIKNGVAVKVADKKEK